MAVVALAGALSVAAPAPVWAASAVPFTDPSAQGLIGFCGRDNQPVTSGSLTDQPFVWKAVATVAAPPHYSEAFLTLYQPIEHVDPSAWTGYQLTDTAVFKDPQHPAAQATNVDVPLIGADQSYPPYWNGLYQIRMFFAGPQMTPWTQTYPAAVIQVTGSKWTLVQGGTVDCAASQAISTVAKDLPQSVLQTPQTVVVHSAPAGSPTTTASGPGQPKPVASATTTLPSSSGATSPTSAAKSAAGGATAAGATHPSGSGGNSGWVAVVASAVVVLGGGGTVWWRRRLGGKSA
ncbi:MAG: hypothetical protein KGQ66_15360 [Acidobacteriota bacterium]|nr:hypothetical protein [Acidobacteriota bacterium]